MLLGDNRIAGRDLYRDDLTGEAGRESDIAVTVRGIDVSEHRLSGEHPAEHFSRVPGAHGV